MPRSKFKPFRKIELVIGPSIAYVHLTDDLVCLIEAEDIALLRGRDWWASESCSTHYAFGWVDGRNLQLHNFLIKPEAGLTVDHKNGNGLDNRRYGNLRKADKNQQASNAKTRKDNKYGKGVIFFKKLNKYGASIQRDKKRIFLGLRDTPKEAGELYWKAAKELHGEFVRLE